MKINESEEEFFFLMNVNPNEYDRMNMHVLMNFDCCDSIK